MSKLVKIPTTPKTIKGDREAIKLFKAICQQLIDSGELTKANTSLVEMAVCAQTQWREAVEAKDPKLQQQFNRLYLATCRSLGIDIKPAKPKAKPSKRGPITIPFNKPKLKIAR